MKLECYICFRKHNRNRFNIDSLLNENIEFFDNYTLRYHLQEKHTIDEVIQYFTEMHYSGFDHEMRKVVNRKKG